MGHGVSTTVHAYDQHDRGQAATDLMGDHPQKSTGWEFALRLKAFYVALFMTLGVQMPFLPVWFASKGLDAQAIGIVIAVPVMVRILAIPVVTRAADRPDALRRVIILTAATATAGFGVLGFVDGIFAIMVAYNLAVVASSDVLMLADTYALRGLGRWGRAYGPVRLWGSAAFIVTSFGAGALLAVIAAADLIWLIVATMALAMVAAATLAPPGGETPGSSAAPPPATLILRDPSFLSAAAAASLVQASHAVYYGFSTLDWPAAGLKGTTTGAVWARGGVG